MISAPSASRSIDDSARTVARVPTGMNTGRLERAAGCVHPAGPRRAVGGVDLQLEQAVAHGRITTGRGE